MEIYQRNYNKITTKIIFTDRFYVALVALKTRLMAHLEEVGVAEEVAELGMVDVVAMVGSGEVKVAEQVEVMEVGEVQEGKQGEVEEKGEERGEDDPAIRSQVEDIEEVTQWH